MNETIDGGGDEERFRFGQLKFRVDYLISPIATPYIDEIISSSEDYLRADDYLEEFTREVDEHPVFNDRMYLRYMGRTALAIIDFPKLNTHLNGLDGSLSRALIGKIPVTEAPFRRMHTEVGGPL